jgi:hypothetical protein
MDPAGPGVTAYDGFDDYERVHIVNSQPGPTAGTTTM